MDPRGYRDAVIPPLDSVLVGVGRGKKFKKTREGCQIFPPPTKLKKPNEVVLFKCLGIKKPPNFRLLQNPEGVSRSRGQEFLGVLRQ